MPKRLLVVDDDTIFRHMLIEILESEGYEITPARDGKEGLENFKKGTFDLVITDIRMPRMNGFQLAQEIKSLTHNIPIIFVSGWYDPNRDTMEKGMHLSLLRNQSSHLYFLRKPFRISQLFSLIEKATGKTRLNVA